MIKRLLLTLSLAAFGLSCMAEEAHDHDHAAAQPLPESGSYEPGTHYDMISPPVHTASGDKLEVAEYFWYGCGHCYNFEPVLAQWKKTLPEDVMFRPVPAVWPGREVMALHAQAFYAAEALGVLDKMHPVMFQAMNVDHKRLASQGEIEALFTAHGVSAEDFNKAFTSFGVTSQVRQAAALTRSAKITGTPALVVEGKYQVGARKAGTQAGMLQVTDALLAQERAARSQD